MKEITDSWPDSIPQVFCKRCKVAFLYSRCFHFIRVWRKTQFLKSGLILYWGSALIAHRPKVQGPTWHHCKVHHWQRTHTRAVELQEDCDSLAEGLMETEAKGTGQGWEGGGAMAWNRGTEQEEAAAAEKGKDRGGSALVPHVNSLKKWRLVIPQFLALWKISFMLRVPADRYMVLLPWIIQFSTPKTPLPQEPLDRFVQLACLIPPPFWESCIKQLSVLSTNDISPAWRTECGRNRYNSLPKSQPLIKEAPLPEVWLILALSSQKSTLSYHNFPVFHSADLISAPIK